MWWGTFYFCAFFEFLLMCQLGIGNTYPGSNSSKKKKKISAFSSLLEPFVGPLYVGHLFKSCGTVQKPGSCLPFDGFVLKLNTQASLLSFLISGIEVMF
jgi:hypothetical protein